MILEYIKYLSFYLFSFILSFQITQSSFYNKPRYIFVLQSVASLSEVMRPRLTSYRSNLMPLCYLVLWSIPDYFPQYLKNIFDMSSKAKRCVPNTQTIFQVKMHFFKFLLCLHDVVCHNELELTVNSLCKNNDIHNLFLHYLLEYRKTYTRIFIHYIHTKELIQETDTCTHHYFLFPFE